MRAVAVKRLCCISLLASLVGASCSTQSAPTSPVKHVIIIDEENHSFDNIFGRFCADVAAGTIHRDPCDGALSGKLHSGATIALQEAADQVPNVEHTVEGQIRSIAHGAMDGFDLNALCHAQDNHQCYSTFDPAAIPNETRFASHFAISDHTFELAAAPSWGGHLVIGAGTLDGFLGKNPHRHPGVKPGPGWGCDSRLDSAWVDPRTKKVISEPSCVPDAGGKGPYRPSPVAHVPTIFDHLTQRHVSWKVYAGTDEPSKPQGGWAWAVCPSFADCLFSSQRRHIAAADQIKADAGRNQLPSFALVTPDFALSEHGLVSMKNGDNWVGSLVAAVERSPAWSSTVIFLTYDDSGGFYDHLAPPASSLGIRLPVVIISPFAKPGYTDSNDATPVSMLAFTEHTFAVPPLNGTDRHAYDYSRALSFTQQPTSSVAITTSSIPAVEAARLQTVHDDPNDPT